MATFLGRPLLDIRPNFENPRIGQLDDFQLRGGEGILTPWKETTTLKRKLSIPFLFTTKAEWRELRDFIADRRGNLEGFWMPTYITSYVSSTQQQGSTLITIEPVGLADIFTADEQFAFVALISKTEIEPLEIANVTVAMDGKEELNLATTISGSFTSRDVCCPLLYVRLADDGFKTEWITAEVSKVTLTLVELPMEYATASSGSRPIYLYEFTKGGVIWRTTDHTESVIVGDEIWTPENIKHSSTRATLNMLPGIGTLTIRTDSADHPLRDYLQKETVEKTDLRIFRTTLDDLTIDENAPLFTGECGKATFGTAGEISFPMSSNWRIGEESFPRKKAQRTCNHEFCDVNCTLSEATFTIDGILTDQDDAFVEASEFGDEAIAQGDPQWFALGKVRLNGEVRQVMGQVGDKLYINWPFKAATLGDDVQAVPGCNKRPSHCETRYSNIANSTMFPLMPNSNPQFQALKVPKSGGGKKG